MYGSNFFQRLNDVIAKGVQNEELDFFERLDYNSVFFKLLFCWYLGVLAKKNLVTFLLQITLPF